MRNLISSIVWIMVIQLYSQQGITVRGRIIDGSSGIPLSQVLISWKDLETTTNELGFFKLSDIPVSSFIMHFKRDGYNPINLPVDGLGSQEILLGDVSLQPLMTEGELDAWAGLSEDLLYQSVNGEEGGAFLRANGDLFHRRSSFDFGNLFYRIRGYDDSYGVILINGIPVNHPITSRPIWSGWGGLNDVFRQQQYLAPADDTEEWFPEEAGVSSITVSPEQARPGFRLTSSVSNRSYLGRIMGTWNSGISRKGWSYSLSASGRWAKSGMTEGTPYEALSVFGGVSWKPSSKERWQLLAWYTPVLRGVAAPLTQEVISLMGDRYNPYWGWQEGKLRSSRLSYAAFPTVQIMHSGVWKKVSWQWAVMGTTGVQGRTRLGYYGAPNPDPVYYRYLPSYYFNRNSGPDLYGAYLATEAFLKEPQISWGSLYAINMAGDGLARYHWYEDVSEEDQVTAQAQFQLPLSRKLKLSAGVRYRYFKAHQFARILDLLGASYHLDIDPFSGTRNHTEGSSERKEGDIFSYNYTLKDDLGEIWLQGSYPLKHILIQGGIRYSTRKTVREGLFHNEKYLLTSAGPSEPISLNGWAAFTRIVWEPSSRHRVQVHGSIRRILPPLRNLFHNLREENRPVPEPDVEQFQGISADYLFHWKILTGRLSGYYGSFTKGSDLNYYFSETSIGNRFIREAVHGIQREHVGGEAWVSAEVSPELTFSAIAARGWYRFKGEAGVLLHSDPEELNGEPVITNPGPSNLNGVHPALGPQGANSVGLEYRDPSFWRVSVTLNHLYEIYADPSIHSRTPAFTEIPKEETGPLLSLSNQENLTTQKSLPDVYLTNLTGGASWKWDKAYLSLFIGISNLFDTSYLSGGFEQGRNGTLAGAFQDELGRQPSFAPKYWSGNRRSYFINLSYSF